MSSKNSDNWNSSEYPHMPDDADEPDVWEKENAKKAASPPKKLEPDTRSDFHGDDELEAWEKENS